MMINDMGDSVNSKRKRRRRPRRSIAFSRLARAIFFSNLLGLLILIIGALALNQFSNGLVRAKIENLQSKAELITNILADSASGTEALAQLDLVAARQIMSRVSLPEKSRARLFDQNGDLVADTALMNTDINVTTLDPIVGFTETPSALSFKDRVSAGLERGIKALPWVKKRRQNLQRNIEQDIRKTLKGDVIKGEQYDDDVMIVSVNVPVKRVQAVLGVVTLESSDVDEILAGERRALTPIILLAFITALLSSFALTLNVALPVRKLARAAERVRRSGDDAVTIPDMSYRRDEIGDLSVVIKDMTQGLYERIGAIDNFAADVAHEIKNPLTSLRSASDTLRIAKTDAQRKKLIDIVQNDVARMDRLISDISKASRMDAALAQEQAEPLELPLFLRNIADFYTQTRAADSPKVIFNEPDTEDPFIVRAFEIPFSQVLRNLVDNALTFSPKHGEVHIHVAHGQGAQEGLIIVHVDDDGPGIPADSVETIFERFYTDRPKGASFGSHSGLGLAICKQIVEAHGGEIEASNRMADPKSECGSNPKFEANSETNSESNSETHSETHSKASTDEADEDVSASKGPVGARFEVRLPSQTYVQKKSSRKWAWFRRKD